MSKNGNGKDESEEDNDEELLSLLNEVDDADILSSDTPLFSTSTIMKKLDEIENLIKNLMQHNQQGNTSQYSQLCERILERGYVIEDKNRRISNQNIYVIELSDGRALYTFRDTIDLLLKYFDEIHEESEIEIKLPKRLISLFQFLRRNGLIYFDYSEKKFKKAF